MNLIEAVARQYAFTLRKTSLKKQPTPEDYFQHIEKWTCAGLCEIVDNVFEYEAGIHMHGIMEIPKRVDLKRFRVRGWNIKLEEIYNLDGWRYYMLKEQKCNEDNAEYEEEKIEDQKIYNLKYSLFKEQTPSPQTV